MVEMVRRIVSGKRVRYVDEQYELDLTYIIDGRIMATSYPSQGLESFGRNSIDTFARFVHEKHGEKYHIINVSERQIYDAEQYFGGRVTAFLWPDHTAPPLVFLF